MEDPFVGAGKVAKYIINFKSVEMNEEEHKYYEELVKSFSTPEKSGKNYFRDLFDVDEDGCIMFIRPPLKMEVPWAVLVFLQNLMINQRLRRMEKKVEGFVNDHKSTDD